jgi:hypothetical protein
MDQAVATWPDREMAALLATRLAYWRDFEDMEISELACVVLVESGDTLTDLDVVLNGDLLSNPWAGTAYGDIGFRPCYESATSYPTFIEVEFIQGDFCFVVFLQPDTATEIRSLFTQETATKEDAI